MSSTDRGLYEALITEALEAQLGALGDRLEPRRSQLHEAEAADRIALHLARVIERALDSVDKSDRVRIGTALARRLVEMVVESTAATSLTAERPVDPAQVLRSVLGKQPDGRAETIAEPLTPLLDT